MIMRVAALVVCVGLLASACGRSGESPSPEATDRHSPPPTEATARADLDEEPIAVEDPLVVDEEIAEQDGPVGAAAPVETVDALSSNDAIGLGAGAGGAFGARRGGRGRPARRAVEAEAPSAEAYSKIDANVFHRVAEQPLSTFSIDVDTASYSNVRRFLREGRLPPVDAVRIEELVNYFAYAYPEPDGEVPFSVTPEVATCPWNLDHRLVRIGLQGRSIRRDDARPSNLVFLVDVSGSMNHSSKLPLLVSSMKLLVEQLGEQDTVSIVVYAGASGVALEPTTGTEKGRILAALEQLRASGSTNGASGILLAYDLARANFREKGINRVILATDGDFNVGTTSEGELIRLIEEQAKTGVFLTTLGFGTGNLKDATLEKLANRGNGHYAYIDSLAEARKVLVEEIGATLMTIAKDVKIQVEFNPALVSSWRLIGYENRVLTTRDFADDAKDAGEIGAGHRVTAFYEIVPAWKESDAPPVSDLRYQSPRGLMPAAAGREICHLELRYKEPDSDTSTLTQIAVIEDGRRWLDATPDFKFAASVASFGMLLRTSEHRGTATYDSVAELAGEGAIADPHGRRQEFLDLVRTARALSVR